MNVIEQGSDELGLFVIDEDETLLLHRIVPGDIYRKQEGMLVFHKWLVTSAFFKYCWLISYMRQSLFAEFD